MNAQVIVERDYADLIKVRMVLQNVYKVLKPIEKLIYEDCQTMKADCPGVLPDMESQTLEALLVLCEAYHTYVDLCDRMQDDTSHTPLAEENDELPNIFVPELKANKQAAANLKKVLTEISPKVNAAKGLREEKWRWPHVKDALLQLKLTDCRANNTTFGVAINKLLPERSAKSIEQSFKSERIGFCYPTEIDKNIISDIVKVFQVVLIF